MTLNDYIQAYRGRPSDWIGAAPHAFSGLVGFMSGYSEACKNGVAQSHKPDVSDREFPIFVRRTLNARHPERQYASGLSWSTIIMSEACGDDRTAFYLFYELWDIFHQKKANRRR